jgi:hypothetical protein
VTTTPTHARPLEPRNDDYLRRYAVNVVPSLPAEYQTQVGLTCGERNLRTVLDAFGVDARAEERPRLRTRLFGLSFVADIRAALVRHGLDAEIRHATDLHDESRLALLRGHIDSHEPVILAIGTGLPLRGRGSEVVRAPIRHFITIYGYDAERDVFFTHDPCLRGESPLPLPAGNVERTTDEILRDWKGPFFHRWIGLDHVYLPISGTVA